MSDKVDDYDIIMSEKPKADIHEAYKGFFNMKLHGEDVPGTGKGKGSDDLTLDDLMKMKPEPQPELPVGETPDMMFDTPYVEDEYPTSNMVKMGRVNPLFGPHVNFNVEGNKTYVYEKQKPIAAAASKKKTKKSKKKSGGKKKRKKKTRGKRKLKKKMRKKRGGGGAASSLRRRIPREGMTIETMRNTGEGRVVEHDRDSIPYSTPINFNYENELRALNERNWQQINEIDRIHKDEYGYFKSAPFINHNEEWTRKYNELKNNYDQQKARLDSLKEQYQTASVVHENIGTVSAPEAQGGGRKKKTRRRKINCGSITVKLKYKDRN